VRFDDGIACWLKLFTGETNPKSLVKLTGNIRLRDRRRLFFDEMPEDIRNKIIEFFKDNRLIVLTLKESGGKQWRMNITRT